MLQISLKLSLKCYVGFKFRKILNMLYIALEILKNVFFHEKRSFLTLNMLRKILNMLQIALKILQNVFHFSLISPPPLPFVKILSPPAQKIQYSPPVNPPPSHTLTASCLPPFTITPLDLALSVFQKLKDI